MAWGTYFNIEINISRELFQSKQDLEDKNQTSIFGP